MSNPQSSPDSDATKRSEQIRQIVKDCVVGRVNGQVISDESLIQSHPDLMPELADELRNLRMIEQAERKAEEAEASGLHIRCPHCHNPVELVDDASLSDVVCPSCGSQFSLVDDSPRTYQASSQQTIGHFQLLDKVGIGAFGSVWSARDTELDRQVAVKIPRKGQLSPEDGELFVREARAAAQLKHPHIVSVLEVGRHEDRIYIVTEFVQGLDLADWLTDQQASPREAAELCATMADALQHAHDHGVIHRDLKPSNIMLDTNGEPHLMDFGLAKRESGEMTMTIEGKLLGTPAYMSPEQARGAAHDADARSDVYSLGVILFELLTGERPFRGSTRMLLHQVLVEDAPSLHKLNSQIPKDLETVCLKCLEKAPNQRYQTAADLREELRRFLRGEPVQARAISGAARAWRWSKRRPALASFLALVTILATVGPLIAVKMAALASSESGARRTAEQVTAELRQLLYRSDMAVAQDEWSKANLAAVVELLERHRLEPGEKDLRGFEWYYFWKACQRSIMSQTGIDDVHVAVSLSSNGKTLFLQTAEGIVEHRSVSTLETIRRYKLTFDGREDVNWPRGSLSGDGLSSIVGRIDGISIHDLENETEQIVELAGRGGGVFSLGGETFAAFSKFGEVCVGDSATGKLRFSVDGHDDEIYCASFSPDGKTLATGGRDEKVKLWNVATGELLNEIDVGEICTEKSSVFSVCFSPDGTTLATGTSGDYRVATWNLASGSLVHDLGQHQGYVTSLAFTPTGTTLVSGARFIRVWATATGRLVDEMVSGQTVTGLSFSAGGKTCFSCSAEGLRRWHLVDRANPSVFWGDDSLRVGVLSNDERFYAAAGNGSEIVVVDTQALEVKVRLPDANANSLAFKDSRWLASGGRDGIKLWDVATETLINEVPGFGPFSNDALAFLPGDDILAVGTDNGLRFWDFGRNQDVKIVDHDIRFPTSIVTFSPDGKLFAARVNNPNDSQLRPIHVWEIPSGKRRYTLSVPRTSSMVFSSDGSRLLTGTDGGPILVWNAVSGQEEFRLSGLGGPIENIATSSDGKTIVGGAHDIVGFWNVETQQLRFRLNAHRDSIFGMALTRDARTLMTASVDDTVKIWRTATPDEVSQIRRDWREASNRRKE